MSVEGPRYLVDFDLGALETVPADCVVVGTGIAGLYTALKVSRFARVIVLTKKEVEESSTEYAQGGIAAAIGREDSPRLHMADTLEAGAGLCDPSAVEVLVNEGPERVMELVEMGTQFDKMGNDFALTREAAHRARRVLHARGDATGYEIERALSETLRRAGSVRICEGVFAIDLVTEDDACLGVLAMRVDTRELAFYGAPATVVATGGAGHVYSRSTNPSVATGDGIAMAYRAGAEVADMEFVQFHPTALHQEGSPKFLVSEAMRGEGALLLNVEGERFMPRYHERAELAPRDVVSRAVTQEMRRTGADHVLLDARPLGRGVKERFPTIYRTCLRHGYDISTEPIPVAPAAHYIMGGIRTDADGRTNVRGLYACGEAACVGVHGANRLAANSLLEGLVFGHRIAAELERTWRAGGRPGPAVPRTLSFRLERGPRPDVAPVRRRLQDIMWEQVGIIRDAHSLAAAAAGIEGLGFVLYSHLDSPEAFEAANLVTIGKLITRAAIERRESRGAHYRVDFPAREDVNFRRRITQRRGAAPRFSSLGGD